ncbi:hypothetical protein FGB62_209g012 [Gracilaria domingensis]|nr:hypothetical protein FGB62_209g012 [Gracilaria domingensis]
MFQWGPRVPDNLIFYNFEQFETSSSDYVHIGCNESQQASNGLDARAGNHVPPTSVSLGNAMIMNEEGVRDESERNDSGNAFLAINPQNEYLVHSHNENVTDASPPALSTSNIDIHFPTARPDLHPLPVSDEDHNVVHTNASTYEQDLSEPYNSETYHVAFPTSPSGNVGDMQLTSEEDIEGTVSGVEASDQTMERNSYKVLQWLQVNEAWVQFSDRWRVQREGMDAVLSFVKAPLRSLKSVTNNLVFHSGLRGIVQIYKVCPGHMAFVSSMEDALSTNIVFAGLFKTKIPAKSSIAIDRPEKQVPYGGPEKLENDVFIAISMNGFHPL